MIYGIFGINKGDINFIQIWNFFFDLSENVQKNVIYSSK